MVELNTIAIADIAVVTLGALGTTVAVIHERRKQKRNSERGHTQELDPSQLPTTGPIVPRRRGRGGHRGPDMNAARNNQSLNGDPGRPRV